MSSCLGLFIQDNLIKYAKVSKENDNVKVENYGMKFFEDDLKKNIEQIVDETYSYKIPISVNLEHEKYANSEIFSLLSDSDQKKSIRTEFEYFCNETNKNRLALEYKTVVSDERKDNDKKNVLYAYAEKGNVAERIQLLDPYKLSYLTPTALTIGSLASESNCIIVNIEDRTEVTLMERGIETKVSVLDVGMKDILKKISEKENSLSRAYEICKNTTLYTASSQNLQTDTNEYLEIIVPNIYKITEEIRKNILNEDLDIEKIYITGMGAMINNIDLYFQENFLDYKCEILTPYFVNKANLKINVKEYIEVNSAIAMALQYLNKRNKEVSFCNSQESFEKFKKLLTSDVSIGGKGKSSSKANKTININIKDISCIRFAYSMFMILVIYIVVTSFIHKKIDDKTTLAQQLIDDTKAKTEQVNSYNTLVKARTENYQSVLEQLEEANNRVSEKFLSRNAIPNLLSEIMFAIPKEAQILSLQNSEGKHIIMQAQASEYQYLGYFKSELQNRAILVNVKSTPGTKTNDMIQVTIEGDLPY